MARLNDIQRTVVYICVVFMVTLAQPATAWASEMENLFKIREGVNEIARQRDEAIRDRDRKCRDYTAMETDDRTNTATILNIINSAPDAEYTIIKSADPAVSVCLMKIGKECVLGYDGKVRRFYQTRGLDVGVTLP